MKWSKFQELTAKHPFLTHDLTWRGASKTNKEFIRTKVGFIAPRPFEKLDLASKATSSGTPLSSKYVHAQMESYKAVSYQISFHIEDEPEASRLRYITSDVGDGSIQAHIDDITTWFESCDAFRGKQIIWERVVRRTVSGSSFVGLSSMNLEFYLFPKFYRFRTIPIDRPVTNPARYAYFTGGEMPPIIPGSRD